MTDTFLDLKMFFTALAFMLALDFLWLGLIATPFYVQQFEGIGRIVDGKFDIVYWAGIAAYVLMAAAIVIFVMPKIGADAPWWTGLFWGALMGLVTFGIYDMTNLATLKQWPTALWVVDIAWGCALNALTVAFLQQARGWLNDAA